MRRKLCLFLALFMTLASLATLRMPTVHAGFSANLLIDDTVFSDSAAMSAAQIDAFLNNATGQVANSCISTNSGFAARVPSGYSPSAGFSYGGFGSAGQVIAAAAQVYGLNPAVLLVTLQKEQSLVSASANYCNNGSEHKYAAAVGYGCPDNLTVHAYNGISLYMRNGVEHTSVGETCVDSQAKAGFSQQLIRAAWLLKFGQQRSLGNVSWAVITGSWDNSDDPPTCYSGPMTQGLLKRCQSGSAASYDGYTTIDSSATHMDTGATAALYWYTPHFHGNQNFVAIFESWFGSTVSSLYYSCHNATNVAVAATGRRILAGKISGKTDNLSLNFLNNTGSACIESHTWGANQQNWISNTATNHPALNPADNTILTADTNGDGIDEFYLIKYRNTQSGKIEIHQWDATKQHWANNLATNHPAVDPGDNRVIAGDTNGDGKDELILVKYRNSQSGKIEIHTWNPGYQSWYSNIAANYPAVDPADTGILSANTATDGDNKDKLILVKYRNSQSGKIEIHTWNPGYQSWYSNLATNHPAVDPADDEIISADTAGVGKDKLTLIKYNNSQSGKIEIHTWNPGYQSWYSNLATSYPSIGP